MLSVTVRYIRLKTATPSVADASAARSIARIWARTSPTSADGLTPRVWRGPGAPVTG